MRVLNQPVTWWGWHWSPPQPLSIVEIIDRRSMSARLAALFWLGLERAASLLIVAEPPLAGKTATLTALLAFLPPQAVAYFTRGLGETFDLPPASDRRPTYILVNEISDHLPTYTWGRYARCAFELLEQGYRLATTMHADSVAEAMAILENDLSIPRRHLARLTFIAALRMAYRGGRNLRRMGEVAFLRPSQGGGDGLEMSTIATWQAEDDSFRVMDSAEEIAALAAWAGLGEGRLLAELERREEFLQGLSRAAVREPVAVREAVLTYYSGLSLEGQPRPPATRRSRGRRYRRPPSSRPPR